MEFASGEGVEGAEASSEFGGGQAAFAVEPAEEVSGGAIPFLRVALQTAGDEVAIGIAPEGHARHNVIEAANQGRKPTQAIEAATAFSHMDGVAQSPVLEEVHLEVDAARKGPGAAAADPPGADGTNFVGQPHFDHVTGFAAFDQAQNAMGDKTAQGPTGGVGAEASTKGEPKNRKSQPPLPFQAAVPQEVRIDGAVRDGQAQPGNEMVFELFPDLCGVGFFVFHGSGPEVRRGRAKARPYNDLGRRFGTTRVKRS